MISAQTRRREVSFQDQKATIAKRYLQRSSMLLDRLPFRHGSLLVSALVPYNLGPGFRSDVFNFDTLSRGVDNGTGHHLTFCGHYIHNFCLEQYFLAVIEANASAILMFELNGWAPPEHLYRERENGEFYCPLCRKLANTFMPLLPVEKKTPTERVSPTNTEAWSWSLDQIFRSTCHSLPIVPTPRLCYVWIWSCLWW